MAAKRDRIFELVEGWRKEHTGEPITRLLEEISDVTALKSAPLKDIRSWLAECESKKTAVENEFPRLERVYLPFSEQQEDWEYNFCDDLIPHLRLEISRRGRTGTQLKEIITSNDSASLAQPVKRVAEAQAEARRNLQILEDSERNNEKTAQSAGRKATTGAGTSHNRTEKNPQQAPTRTKRRTLTVSRLLKELRTVRPKMHNESDYGQVKRAHPKYLIFQIAERDSEVRTWIENVQDRRGLVGLAQEVAARHCGVTVATIKTDWSHRKKPRQSPRKPL
jgi:hypothetical protein